MSDVSKHEEDLTKIAVFLNPPGWYTGSLFQCSKICLNFVISVMNGIIHDCDAIIFLVINPNYRSSSSWTSAKPRLIYLMSSSHWSGVPGIFWCQNMDWLMVWILPHRIHGTGTFTYIYHKNQPSM